VNGHAPNEGVGAAQAKTGMQGSPLNRGIGLSETEGAMSSKTRSPHNSAGGPNYLYQDIPSGPGENVVGYGEGNGGSGNTPAGTHD